MAKGPGGSNATKRGEVGGPNGPVIAALLTSGAGFPFAAFAKLLQGELICGHKISANTKDNMCAFELDGGFGGLFEMPTPYPWTDLEGPCETSWMWPDDPPVSILKSHRNHILATIVKTKMPPVIRRMFLTQIVAMAARNENVLGVYWPEGTQVHHPKRFCNIAAELSPPLPLWIDYRVLANRDGTFAMFTTGMEAIGLMEIEILTIDMDPGDLREWGMSLTQYQLDNGPILKDGDTIGPTEVPEFKIRYRTSRFGHQGNVMAIEKRK